MPVARLRSRNNHGRKYPIQRWKRFRRASLRTRCADREPPQSQSARPRTNRDRVRPQWHPARRIRANKAANSRRTNQNVFDCLRRREQTAPAHSRARQCSLARRRVRAREFSLRLSFSNQATVFAFQLEGKPLRLLRNQSRITVSPFDQRNAFTENVIVESESQDGLAAVEPIKIEMINGQAATLVLVQEDKGRARHFRAASQACHEAFDELRLSRAEISGSSEHITLARTARVTA